MVMLLVWGLPQTQCLTAPGRWGGSAISCSVSEASHSSLSPHLWFIVMVITHKLVIKWGTSVPSEI